MPYIPTSHSNEKRRVNIQLEIYLIIYIYGAKGDWDFWISDLVKNTDGTDI